MDSVIEALLTDDVAKVLNRVSGEAVHAVSAKQLTRHEELKIVTTRILGQLGIESDAVNQLAIKRLPALFAALYASEREGRIVQKPGRWSSDSERFAAKYVS